MAYSIPSYLLVSDEHARSLCYGCEEAVKVNPATGRAFITMGHPAFNSPANNRTGYASPAAALAAVKRYGGGRG